MFRFCWWLNLSFWCGFDVLCWFRFVPIQLPAWAASPAWSTPAWWRAPPPEALPTCEFVDTWLFTPWISCGKCAELGLGFCCDVTLQLTWTGTAAWLRLVLSSFSCASLQKDSLVLLVGTFWMTAGKLGAAPIESCPNRCSWLRAAKPGVLWNCCSPSSGVSGGASSWMSLLSNYSLIILH
jgi:hypothetical protein